LGAVGIGLLVYIIYDFHLMIDMHYKNANDRLSAAIKLFPKTPKEYNVRETNKYAQKYWRRYNLRAISITSGAVLTTLFLIIWHRNRTVALHRRKTWLFWGWTLSAGFLAAGYALTLAPAQQQPF
jgi:hypothetical protein